MTDYVTPQAEDIMERLVPEFTRMFLAKNLKYRHVDNSLGAKGVFPDIHRKTGILKARLWDGDAVVGEPTREVMMDLIGHLFLAIHMSDVVAMPPEFDAHHNQDPNRHLARAEPEVWGIHPGPVFNTDPDVVAYEAKLAEGREQYLGRIVKDNPQA